MRLFQQIQLLYAGQDKNRKHANPCHLQKLHARHLSIYHAILPSKQLYTFDIVKSVKLFTPSGPGSYCCKIYTCR